MNVHKKQNNSIATHTKIIQVDGPTVKEITTIKRTGINTELAVSNPSIVPSERTSNFKSIEDMQQQVINTKIIFQR